MSQRGKRVASNFLRISLVLVVTLGFTPASAYAIDLDALRQRLDEQKAAREARLQELRDQLGGNTTPGASDTPSPTEEPEGEPEQPACSCSAHLSFAPPAVQWHNNTLQFVPKFNLKITVDGDSAVPPWQVLLAYQGQAHTVSFQGQQQFGGQCFDGKYQNNGLSGNPVAIPDVVRSLFGEDSELETAVRMQANITGCDTDEEARQSKVTIEEFGNLKVRGWRIWRP